MMRAVESSPGPRAPLADPELRGLGVALDPERAASRIAAALATGFAVAGPCEIRYVRYKPCTSALVAYRIALRDRATGEVAPLHVHAKCLRRGDWQRADAKRTAHRWSPARSIDAVVAAPDLDTLFFAFPNDAEMPGLRLVGDRKRLRRFLAAQLVEYPSAEWRLSDSRLRAEVVRSKPERRAVLRLQTVAVHRTSGERRPVVVWLRAYAGDAARAVERLGGALHAAHARGAGVTVPRVLGADHERGIVLFESLPGTHPAGADLRRCAGAIGRDLARLHASREIDAPVQRIADRLDNVAAVAAALAHVAPEFAARIQRIETILRQRAPRDLAAPTLVHGDFAPSQLLVHAGRIGWLDFDRAHRGDPLADVGSFLAHLHEQRVLHGLVGTTTIGRRFVDAYAAAAPTVLDRERLSFFTLNGLLLASIRPFRSYQPQWKAAVGATLAACEELIV